MAHSFRITLSLLLVTAHALLVPVHVAWEHGPGAALAHAGTGGLHVHGPEDGHHDHHDEHDSPAVPAPARSGQPEVFDASDYGQPHQHDTHAHSETDHGFARARKDASIFYPPALAPNLNAQIQAMASQTDRISEAPPPRAPTLSHPSLRGPPVG